MTLRCYRISLYAFLFALGISTAWAQEKEEKCKCPLLGVGQGSCTSHTPGSCCTGQTESCDSGCCTKNGKCCTESKACNFDVKFACPFCDQNCWTKLWQWLPNNDKSVTFTVLAPKVDGGPIPVNVKFAIQACAACSKAQGQCCQQATCAGKNECCEGCCKTVAGKCCQASARCASQASCSSTKGSCCSSSACRCKDGSCCSQNQAC